MVQRPPATPSVRSLVQQAVVRMSVQTPSLLQSALQLLYCWDENG